MEVMMTQANYNQSI